ncbi:hypothetical protein G7054_g13911 [Neopestalotiopsis clavispora]|nr:hypothetical protein G7054_g13911 [Neopestalotiopsis clavispora]
MSSSLRSDKLFAIDGLIAVITGGGSGLGLMMAMALAENGASRIYIVGRNQDKLQKAAELFPLPAGSFTDPTFARSIIPLPGDITSQDSLKAIAERVSREAGHIDLLIANAGMAGPGLKGLGPRTTVADFARAAWATPATDFDKVYNLNCTGTYYTIIAFLELLDKGNKCRKPNAPRSQVIITSSMVAFQREPRYGFAYLSSKAALVSMLKCFTTQGAGWGIRFNSIAPGLFPTEMSEQALVPFKVSADKELTSEGAFASSFLPAERAGSAEDIGGALLYLTITGLALAIASLFAVYAFLDRWQRRRKLWTIPSPDKDVLLWGRRALPPNAPDVMRKWAGQYGELFRIRVGWYDWVVINSPEAFKEIMDKQSISTSSKIPAPIGHDVVTKGLRIFTMAYGPQWRLQRSIMHRLLAPKPTLEFVPSQEFEVKHLLHQLAFDNEDQESFFNHVRRMSLSVVASTTYGRRIDSQDDPDMRSAAHTAALLGSITRPGVFIEDDIPLLGRLPKFLHPSRRKAMKYAGIVLSGKMGAWNRLKEEVDAGIAAPSFGRDLVENELKSGKLTDEDAAWLTGGLVDAGAEITAVVLHNLILFLAATPEAQNKAHQELDRVVGRSRVPSFGDINKLPYVRACVKEILRLCPVPPWAIKHFSDAEVLYKHHRIPKGTVLLANTSFLHWDPERYNEPWAFQPERFVQHAKSSAESAVAADPRQRDNFTFGGGRRICPAMRLAENTLDITAANILWAFDIKPPTIMGKDGIERAGPVDTSSEAFQKSSFNGPKPFKVRFVPRSKDHLDVVQETWRSARNIGYELRGQKLQVVGGGHETDTNSTSTKP